MTTAIREPTADRPPQRDGQSFVIHGVGWNGYLKLLEAVGNRPVRVTYDRGDIELMSPLSRHETYKQLIGRLIETIAEECGIRLLAAGSTTFHRKDVDRGLDPDRCYYFASAHKVRDRNRIDLAIDPPPDLAVEVDITSHSFDRFAIYAALGVPEIWRFDDDGLAVLLRQPDGTYRASAASAAMPFLPMAEVSRRLLDYDLSDDSRWGREIRAWVRTELVGRE
jgi:Uma2 family endonuclease